jgi:hypothetical protein
MLETVLNKKKLWEDISDEFLQYPNRVCRCMHLIVILVAFFVMFYMI